MNEIYVICMSSDNFSFFDFNLFKIIIFSKIYIYQKSIFKKKELFLIILKK